jgi:hypothetical protein
MRTLTCTLLLGATLLAGTGCDDILEGFGLDVAYYGDPGYCCSGPGGYYEDTYVVEEYYDQYWYEETYYEDAWYAEWSFWPW